MKYKVGDKVKLKSKEELDRLKENFFIHNLAYEIAGSVCTICEIREGAYRFEELSLFWAENVIEGLVEEEMSLDKAGQITDFEYEGLAYTLPDGYIFKDENGNVINATKIVLEKKKKPKYPKTIEECCAILGLEFNPFYTGVKRQINYKDGLLHNLKCLLIYRDAYWKIAGEEMGLGKPWEPDWEGEGWYVIVNHRGDIVTDIQWHANAILAFPTEEMRNAFKENFDPDIEICKEFL